ncbi:hypothetical protein Tc00.1047053510829.20 [Trypanosoma cruzi]|uniref:Uncharacterized protein n=1 Tax=Trypanosoma cruzi (strain CL Brener) TaxID=353153 RepID=Q4CZZ0_TRYCC|nr:hypothetical protein Tc00.1047053510829.20 [Trypanosoma cruzi]EAN85843.1 hypothetical protein Tc00.1047053510829.20 [Trypanosoma cruzi]|eukprot:XP_807694.1 hypothetical protein [Trypanosoma cruzi strain CL Brener]
MTPSGSVVKLLGVKAAIPDQRLAVIHASRTTTRSFQSVRLRIHSSVPFFVEGRACFTTDRAAIFCNPRIIMSSGVGFISDTDRSVLECCCRVDGATSIAIKKAAQLSSFIGCSCVRQKVVNRPARDIPRSHVDGAHVCRAYSFALLI